jgi:nucleotide-binding universal stress UspA family protein
MREMRSKQVVVGVEDVGCEAALRVAAAESRRRRCGIHLVHVAPVHLIPVDLQELAFTTLGLQQRGENVLTQARDRLVELLGEDADEIPVTTELSHDTVIQALVAAGAHAQVLVLQHRGMGQDGGARMLSVTLGVAARTRAPVLAVPDTWHPGPSVETRVVTVGVIDPSVSSGVVRAAVREAAAIGARLRLVHATGQEDEAGGVARGLRAGFAQVCQERPHVPVEVVVAPERPETALVEHSGDSSLLVVGRRHARMPMTPRLGHVVRAVLRRSTCPVLVLNPGPLVVSEFRDLTTLATLAIP